MSSGDLPALLPASAIFTYPMSVSGIGPIGVDFAITVALDDVAQDLVPQFQGVQGAPFVKSFHDLAVASYSSISATGGLPDNYSTLLSLARQSGADWWSLQPGNLDWRTNDVYAFDISPFDISTEYFERQATCPFCKDGTTDAGEVCIECNGTGEFFDVGVRIQREAFNDRTDRLMHQSDAGSSCNTVIGPGQTLVVNNACSIFINASAFFFQSYLNFSIPNTFAFVETDLACQAGFLNEYTRTVTVGVVGGQFQVFYGPWLYVKTVACCDVNCTTGTGTNTGTSTGDGGTVDVPCCYNVQLNTTLHAVVVGALGCPCCTSTSIPVVWNNVTENWQGTGPFGGCGRNITLTFYCTGGTIPDWRMNASWSDGCSPAVIAALPNAGGSCSPLSLNWTIAPTPAGACGCTGVPATHINVNLMN